MKNLKVIIPLKTNSTRVKNKNLRPFYNNQSLFDVKAQQLLQVFSPIDIYVSSENPEVEKLAKEYGFNFHLRDASLTTSTTIESSLVKTLVDAVPDKSCDIMWCQVTQPLFLEFKKLLECYENLDKHYDSICVVKWFSHHLIDKDGNPVNFNFGYWHKLTQDLPALYQVAWAAFIMRRNFLDQAHYQIGRSPYLFKTDAPLVDIDTEQDFEIAQLMYQLFAKKNENG